MLMMDDVYLSVQPSVFPCVHNISLAYNAYLAFVDWDPRQIVESKDFIDLFYTGGV